MWGLGGGMLREGQGKNLEWTVEGGGEGKKI